MVMGVLGVRADLRQAGRAVEAAAQKVVENAPEHLAREGKIGHLQFLTYGLVPLSVGMFPHLFQHWLTAKSAKTFRLTAIVCHPIFIMIVWVPCILIGIWAVGASASWRRAATANAVLAKMVGAAPEASPFVSGS